jgi:hypothetical protein
MLRSTIVPTIKTTFHTSFYWKVFSNTRILNIKKMLILFLFKRFERLEDDVMFIGN